MMEYYKERNGMRKVIEKTYNLDPGMYGVFFQMLREIF